MKKKFDAVALQRKICQKLSREFLKDRKAFLRKLRGKQLQRRSPPVLRGSCSTRFDILPITSQTLPLLGQLDAQPEDLLLKST